MTRTDTRVSVSRIFPAEWAPHAASWFTWPANPDTWTDALDATRQALAKAFLAIAEGEVVLVNVASAEEAEQVHRLTDHHPDVRCLHLPSNDCWCRDHGPTFVFETGRPRAVTWNYNAWGGKYPPYDLDAKLGARMAERVGVPVDTAEITCEGGALETNGRDILLTTASCILNPNRNPGLSRVGAELEFKAQLGLEYIGWFEGELDGDDTDGHIDNLIRFTAEDRILMPESLDTAENRAEFDRLSAECGRPLTWEALPEPEPLLHEGQPLPCSHMNFYITNACVILPAYGGASDAQAARVLKRHFPGRTIVPLDCRHIIRGLGAIHCLSQQVPAWDTIRLPEDDFRAS